MKKIFFCFFSLAYCSLPILAQHKDSLQVRNDSVVQNINVPVPPKDSAQAKKDSVVKIIPIPELGSIEPFGDSSQHLTSTLITFREYRSLYDIIAQEPGVLVRDLASAGQKNQIVINGIDDKNIAIMVDGIPYNDHYTGTFNLWDIPVDAIERVEFITGTSAMFYDGRSAGGTINIVTKNFNNNRASTHLRYSQGISGYTHTDAMFAQNIAAGLNLSFALAHYGFGSNKESQDYRARFYNSNDDAWLIRTKLRYNITQWMDLSFNYSYERRWTGLNGGVNYYNTASLFDGLNAEVNNFEAYEKEFNSHYHLTAAFSPFQDSTLLTSVSLYSFDRLREYRDEENRSVILNGIYTKRDFASIGKGLKLNILSQYSELRFIGYADLARIQSTDILTMGLKADIKPHSFFTLSPFVSFKDYGNQFIANGGIEGKLVLTSSVTLFGGVAQNIINDQPVSVSYTVSPLDASSFSYAHRSKDVFSVQEAGVRYSIPSTLTAEVSYKHYVQNDPIVFDTIPFFGAVLYYNPQKYLIDALSASVHAVWNNFHFEATGNYLKYPKITRNAVSLTLFPEITANGSVYYQGLLANGHLDIKVGLRGNYYSEQTGMRPYDEFGVWIPSTELRYGPSGSLDFFAVGKIGDAYVHLIWENLAGSQYLLAPVYPMYDRNIRFGVSWEFID